MYMDHTHAIIMCSLSLPSRPLHACRKWKSAGSKDYSYTVELVLIASLLIMNFECFLSLQSIETQLKLNPNQ